MNFNNLLNKFGNGSKGSQSRHQQPAQFFHRRRVGSGTTSMLMKETNPNWSKPVRSRLWVISPTKGYQSWQQNRNQPELPQQAFEPPGQLAETHSHVILRTMIAAAASTG